MGHIILKNALYFNRGKRQHADIHIKDVRIEKIAPSIQLPFHHETIDCEGMWVIPGIIDDQVHFREPGLTWKADIASESKAAVAGGTTSFMEMPNTNPPALTQALLEDKYQIAERTSYANYSFFMGASNDNYDEVMRTNGETVCGIKIFMGSSTGNMLVDNQMILEKLFANVPLLIATHCEDEATIRHNIGHFKSLYGDAMTAEMHPLIRSVEGCYLSSALAVDLAKKHNTRLHILHISTAKELALFSNDQSLKDKKITSEVCVHHLYFSADDYASLGNQIKCNPAIKAVENRAALFEALLDDRLDIIATDHAPHTKEEKSKPYLEAPSGLPLVQHSLYVMMDFVHQGRISMEKVVEKMSHAPAECFGIRDRGYIEEGKYADIVIINPHEKHIVTESNLQYKCQWSPFEGKTFIGKVKATFVNGQLVYDGKTGFKQGYGQRLLFDK
ncbi:MAG: dihydroorotase [Chitinophagales bacterium]|nr:dihydroorotase [Chitinophagales bacterium]